MTSLLSGRSLLLTCALAGAAVSMLAGCAGVPVPTRAVAGTTFGLAVGPDDSTFGRNFGFGSATYQDPQRGVLAVRFVKSGTDVTVAAKVVTRVVADPATPIAISGSVSTPHPSFPSVLALGQVLALVDIPKTLPEGLYSITVRRYKTASDLSAGNLIDEGPFDSPLWSNSIYVQAGDGVDHFTPFNGSWATITTTLQPQHVQQVAPLPELILWMPSDVAAATIDITYPDAKMDVWGAYFYRLGTQTAFVQTENVDSNTVRIHVVDPLVQGFLVSLVFKNTQTGYSPILLSEFSYDGGSYYDADGELLDTTGFNPLEQAELR
jgi:hypothetical protein